MAGPHREKYPWWRGLRALAVGWTAFPLTLMLILAIGATTIALQATIKVLAERNSREQAHLAARQLASALEKYTLAFQVLAAQPGLATPSSEQRQIIFDQHHYLLTDFIAAGQIILLDQQGETIFTYPDRPELLKKNHRQQSYFQPPFPNTNIPNFFDVTTEPDSGRKIIGLSLPLYNEDDHLNGLLVGYFYLDIPQHFNRFILPLQENTTGSAYLVDRQGEIIYHSDSQLLEEDLSQQTAINQLRQRNTAGAYTQQYPGRGRQVVGYAPIEGVGWGLIIQTPWSHVFQPVQVALGFVSIALILGLIGLILIVFWAVRWITQPLERLVRQAREVADGHYDSEVNLSAIAEIRELGRTFNHMVSQLASYRHGLQEYVASVTDTQEEERKRIARDLHDGTVQSLIAIGQRLELARHTLEEQSIAESKAQLTELRNMVTETIASVRQFSRDLRPLALEDLGLIPALHFLTNRLTQDEAIETELEIEGEAIGLSPDLETAIYRLVQESLNNIRKHAQASQVRVIVRFLARQTILEVHDNGTGFDVPQAKTDLARRGSFGLLGMEERAHLFGGDISIQSAYNQGTILRVILPHEQLPRRRV